MIKKLMIFKNISYIESDNSIISSWFLNMYVITKATSFRAIYAAKDLYIEGESYTFIAILDIFYYTWAIFSYIY